MGKALMVGQQGMSQTSAQFATFGGFLHTGTESQNQYSATEGADFTNMRARVESGNSGTATFTFRDAGAAGQNTFTITGVAANEDTTSTDTLTAGDLLNLGYTDTGTNAVLDFAACNVTMASGHGNFHIACGSAAFVYDVASSTRFVPFGGTLAADGSATIANTQWKNRGYSSIEAFQIRVTANARVNDSVFRVNVNGVAVGTAITYAAAATGLQSVTGMGLALADGDLVCIQLELLTGVEDLTVSFVGMTLKSTGLHSDVFMGAVNGNTRAASATATYYLPGSIIASVSEAAARIKPGFAARCRNLRCYLSANTYTGAATLKLMVNGVAQITTDIGASGGAGWYENAASVYDITATDEISFEIDEGTSGSITIQSIGVTLGDVQTLFAASAM